MFAEDSINIKIETLEILHIRIRRNNINCDRVARKFDGKKHVIMRNFDRDVSQASL